MKKLSLKMRGFLQALGLVGYCALVGMVFWRGEEWFGKATNFLGPLLVLMLFATSALVSALITLGYSVKLVWKEKKTDEAVKLAMWTAGWLVGFILVIMLGMWLKRSYS